MDPKHSSKKTYSELMNEWAAQRHLVHANRSRLIHPPYDAHPVAKAIGYLGRLGVLLIVPAVGYLIALRQFGTSDAFNDEMSQGLAATLQAKSAESKAATWKMNGLLTIRELSARGNDEAFYESLEATNVGTRVSIPFIFHKEWMLPRVSVADLTIALRSGGKGQSSRSTPSPNSDDDIRLPGLPGLVPTAPQDDTPAPRPAVLPSINTGHNTTNKKPELLHAGFGISPDFAAIRFNALQAASLNATWGTSPVTTGNVRGMQTEFTRTSTGWVISGNGGQFTQGWLDGMLVAKSAITMSASEAVIDEIAFTRAGGGTASMKGKLTFGEHPELTATMAMNNIRLQDLTRPETGNIFDAVGSGTMELSGSVNKAEGIRMKGSLTVGAGRLTGLPILKALAQITGEGQYRQLPVRSGAVEFETSGSNQHGGLIVDVTKLELDLGPLARLRGHYHQEHVRQRNPSQDGGSNDVMKLSGMLELGIPAHLAKPMKKPLLERFFVSDNNGWYWMDLPVTQTLTAQFSKEAGQALLEAHNNP